VHLYGLLSSGMLHHAVWQIVTNILEEHTTSTLCNEKMDAVCSSETLVMIYETTRRHIPEDSDLHSYCCQNLKFHMYL
jgi:hypothetical protein